MEKYIEEIIEIVLDNVSCDHQPGDEYGRGGYVDYSLDNEKEVMKKCLAAIPAYPMKFILKVDEKFIQDKTIDMIEVIAKGKIGEAMSFIRSFINELSDKINLEGDEK